jgi:CubicO group peptidase (beta-lactamase class C family)
MRNLFSVIVFFTVFYAQVSAQNIPAFINDSLDTYINRSITEWGIPGVAVCIVKDGKVIASKGYGVKELGKPDQVDENTLFMIASNTKAMTGTALAILEHEKKCSLSDPVKKWYPEFKMNDPWVSERMTLTDIVTHRIGMETFQGDFMYFNSSLSSSEVINKFSKLNPMYDFRTRWGYCNAGYVLAGECIKNISGISWDEFMRERFFKPLGMNQTLALFSEVKPGMNIAVPHSYFNGKVVKVAYDSMDNMAPAGSVVSSVNDMSKWVIANLDSGRIDGKQVIPYEAIARAKKPESILGRSRARFNRTHFNLYGLGWMLEDYEGREIVSHTGGIDGFVTSVTLLPEEKLGIVVLTNTDHNGFYEALKWEIIDAFLELPYRNYSAVTLNSYQKRNARQEQEIAAVRDSLKFKLVSTKDLKMYEGKYIHDVYGFLEIKQTGNFLTMSFENHPTLTAKLEPIDKNRMLCTYNNPMYGIKVLPFEIENEKVKKMTLSVADFIEFTTYDFYKVK